VGSSGIRRACELHRGLVRLLVWSEGLVWVGGGGSTVSSNSPELMAEAEMEGGGECARLSLGVRFIGEDA
jgi:hypothetical protein